jgi:hypothetical protein
VSGIRRCECGEHMLEDERHLHNPSNSDLVGGAGWVRTRPQVHGSLTTRGLERRRFDVCARQDERWRLYEACGSSTCPR